MKFTNLKRGIAGVCAATLLTGMCVAPAFAGVSVDATGDVDTTAGTADTVVKVAAETANISATVPTQVTVSVAPDGELTFPTTDFKIHVNNGGWPLKVSELGVVPATGFTLSSSDAFSETDSNLFLKLGDVVLKGSPDKNTSALTSFAQTASGVADFNLVMTGKTKNMPYSTTAKELVTLKWTIAPVTA